MRHVNENYFTVLRLADLFETEEPDADGVELDADGVELDADEVELRPIVVDESIRVLTGGVVVD